MTPYYADDWLTVYHGDSRAVMAEMEPESVNCVVTSPPYWGLRDYGTATWDGGDAGCDHIQTRNLKRDTNGGMLPAGEGTRGQQSSTASSSIGFRDVCRRCGAIRIDSQLGLDASPDAYVAALVDVFREVRRVLRSDGTVWLNLGDSYNGVGRGEKANGLQVAARATSQRTVSGLKSKDLVGIPWRVAFALQADGWYLRSDIIWSKPNPMPESVTDRPTKNHEYMFLLSKSPRYYFDADAVREPSTDSTITRLAQPGLPRQIGSDRVPGKTNGNMKAVGDPSGRNIRSVWTIATAPYSGAHFATFPRNLVEPCIKAGTSDRGVCPECGAPWEPVIERTKGRDWNAKKRGNDRLVYGNGTGADMDMDRIANPPRRVGMRPTCRHDAEPVPATVLDPFAGSGTTGMVAQSLSRRAVLIDMSMDYLEQLMERNRHIPLGLRA